jgi:hypothetical protein
VSSGVQKSAQQQQQAQMTQQQLADLQAQQAQLAQQQAMQSQQPAAQAPAPASGGVSQDQINQLTQLGQLRDSGILTQEEFDAKKRQILGF